MACELLKQVFLKNHPLNHIFQILKRQTPFQYREGSLKVWYKCNSKILVSVSAIHNYYSHPQKP